MANKKKKGNLIKHLAKNEQNFTVLNNEFILGKDPPIPLEVLGAIWRIKSLSEDWNFNQRGFAKTCGCSTGKVANIMKFLGNNGYLKIEKIKNDKGQFDSNIYHFYESINTALLKEPKHNPKTNNPQTEKPETEYPVTENQLSNKEYINKESNHIESKDFNNKAQSAFSDKSVNSKDTNSKSNSQNMGNKNNTNGINIFSKSEEKQSKRLSTQARKEMNISKLKDMAREFTDNTELLESLDEFILLVATKNCTRLNKQCFRTNLKLLRNYSLDKQIEIVNYSLRGGYTMLYPPSNYLGGNNKKASVSPRINKTRSKRYIPNVTDTNNQE